MHIETVSFQATQPNTGAAAAAVTGDSLIIKNSKGPATILQSWGFNQVDGFQQYVWPSAHDTTRGFRADIEAVSPNFRMTMGVGAQVEPQETMTITIAGSNTAGDVESGQMLILYDDLPGVTSRLMRWSELVRRVDKITTISATLTGAGAGVYTGAELITAESDLLRANRDYAVLGMTTNVGCAGVSLRGPDTGYQRVTLPGNVDDSQLLQEGFCWLARAYDLALIPIINSGNKAATFLDFIQNENNVSPLVTVYLALLGKS